ncbi:MAG: hypothetical protein ACRBDL_04835 [Alphaproteobacteria bacterium]
MADLDSLIRVRRHTVEEKQKALSELYKQADQLQIERDSLETQRAIEREKAKEADPMLQGFFASYSQNVDNKLEGLDQKRAKLEKRIAIAQDDVREAFGDLKKIEIIDERRKAEHLAEIEKKEMDFLDEAAINGFLRDRKD